jgi:hypothetical protein
VGDGVAAAVVGDVEASGLVGAADEQERRANAIASAAMAVGGVAATF